jgi:hypothetical protein
MHKKVIDVQAENRILKQRIIDLEHALMLSKPNFKTGDTCTNLGNDSFISSFAVAEGNPEVIVSSPVSSTLNGSTITNSSSKSMLEEFENEDDLANRMLADFVDFEKMDDEHQNLLANTSLKSIFSVCL